MQVIDGRPVSIAPDGDVVAVAVKGRKVMELPLGALAEFASGLTARKVGEHEAAAVNDGRKVHVVWTVGFQDPTVVKVGGRKVMQLDAANAEALGIALRKLDSGESGPGEESSAGHVPAPESTGSPAKAGIPSPEGAGAPVGKAEDAARSDQSPSATEDAPAPTTDDILRMHGGINATPGLTGGPAPTLTLQNLHPGDFGYDRQQIDRELLALGPALTEAERDSLYDGPALVLDRLMVEDFALPERQQRRSWSQVTSYEECGWCYRRDRIDKRPQQPAWWNVGGTAVHDAIEDFERTLVASSTQDTGLYQPEAFLAEAFSLRFADGISAMVAESGVDPKEWRAANKGREDGEWWWGSGVNMVLNYARQYREGRDWRVAVANGQPAIEEEFISDFGECWAAGFIDRIDVDARGMWVTDLKSGKQPKDHGQLITYALAVEETAGHEVAGARYYLVREGRFVEFNRDELAPYFDAIRYRFNTMDYAERSGIYLPNLGGMHRCTFYQDMATS